MRRAQPEHHEQVMLFQRIALDWRTRELPICAVPNAGGFSGGFKSNVGRVAKLRAEGVKPGVPDVLCFAHGHGIQNKPCVGLAIELKASKGRVSPEQRAWLLALEAEGWHTVVAYSAEEAFVALARYRGFTP